MHDNLSQILVGTKLIVTKLINDRSGYAELLAICQENLQHAIDENRKIAHRLVTPDIERNSFYEELETLCDTMLTMAGINVQIDHLHCNEELLSDAQKPCTVLHRNNAPILSSTPVPGMFSSFS